MAEWTFIDIFSPRCDPNLEHSNQIFSWNTLAYDDVPSNCLLAKSLAVQKIWQKTQSFHYINPHCDFDLKVSTPICLPDALTHDDAPPHQVSIQKVEQSRKYCSDNIWTGRQMDTVIPIYPSLTSSLRPGGGLGGNKQQVHSKRKGGRWKGEKKKRGRRTENERVKWRKRERWESERRWKDRKGMGEWERERERERERGDWDTEKGEGGERMREKEGERKKGERTEVERIQTQAEGMPD